MNFRDLDVFLAVANHLNFAKVSELVHMSPSSVTRAIQRLEDEVGQKLIERDNRSARLTSAGERFQSFAQVTLGQWRQFQRDVSVSPESLQGELSIFCSVTASYAFLDKLLRSFRSKYPKVDIKLLTGDAAESLSIISRGEADVAIAARPDDLPNNLNFHAIDHVPLQFIAPIEGAEWVSKIDDRNPDLEVLPWIISDHGITRTRHEAWFKGHGVKPNIYSQVSGHEAIVSMVALGVGVGLVPKLVLESSPVKNKIRILDLQPDLQPLSVGVCTLTRHMDEPIVAAFWEEAQKIEASGD